MKTDVLIHCTYCDWHGTAKQVDDYNETRAFNFKAGLAKDLNDDCCPACDTFGNLTTKDLNNQ